MSNQSVRSQRYDELGNRMKAYEKIETTQKFSPNSILCVRIDGRSFSKFTKGLQRPYDERLSKLMIETTKYVVEEHKCLIGFSQSDEMSFIMLNKYGAPCDFDGEKQKLVSSMASSATAYFNAHLHEYLPEKVGSRLPRFDCRIWAVPDVSEATNVILWREQDAVKNSIAMSAHHHFSHKELHKKNGKVMKDMLLTQRDIRWEDYPKFFKSGTYVQRVSYFKTNEDGTIIIDEKTNDYIVRHKIAEVNMVLGDLEHSERIKRIFGDKV